MPKIGKGKTLNENGLKLYSRFSDALGAIFFFTSLLYAGFRGVQYQIQLPASFKVSASSLSPTLMDAYYNGDKIPASLSTFEFPVVTFCAIDPNSTVTLVSCKFTQSNSEHLCPAARPLFQMNVGKYGTIANCISVNGGPIPQIPVLAANDYLEIIAQTNSFAGIDGVYVLTHQQLPPNTNPEIAFENSFLVREV